MSVALALDTSTRQGDVAVGRLDGALHLLGHESLEVSATHSETVLPAIDRLLRGSGLAPGDLDAVVVGAGPGSFTGVRIAAALARGQCFGGRAALYAYSSLAATALAAGVEGRVCAVLDARRGQVYSAGYDVGPESVVERFSPGAGSLATLLGELDPAAWWFAGDLPAPGRERIVAAGGRLAADGPTRPSAVSLLRLLNMAPAAGRVAEPGSWEPRYVRGSSAERRIRVSGD